MELHADRTGRKKHALSRSGDAACVDHRKKQFQLAKFHPHRLPFTSAERCVQAHKPHYSRSVNLTRIQTAPTPETSVILLHPTDNVAIARVALSSAQPVAAGGSLFSVREAIPVGHKVAVREIPAGATILRYGSPIGRATCLIEAGQHVHSHNLAFEGINTIEAFPWVEQQDAAAPEHIPTFQGYLRSDGRAGTRNYIAVAAASNCAAHVAELIAQRFPAEALPPGVDGVVAFPHGEGCGHTVGPDTEQLHRVIAGVLDHPNVSFGLLIGLGCGRD